MQSVSRVPVSDQEDNGLHDNCCEIVETEEEPECSKVVLEEE